MNSPSVTSRPVVYIQVGWGLVALAAVVFLGFLFFPRAPAPQYRDAMTQGQSLVAFPGTLLLVALLALWLGYRVCIVADENGVRWRQGRVWRQMAWDEIGEWAFEHNLGSDGWFIRGTNGEILTWDGDCSNYPQLAALVARQMGRDGGRWPVRFAYSGLMWQEKVVVPPLIGVLFGVSPAVLLAYWLWTSRATLPYPVLAMALLCCIAVACIWVIVVMIRLSAWMRRAEGRYKHERIVVDGDELTWSDGVRTWHSRLTDLRLHRERNGDWRFEMPQGEFVVERGVRWRDTLRQTLERQDAVSHLDFVRIAPGSATRFGFDTPGNKLMAVFPAGILFFYSGRA